MPGSGMKWIRRTLGTASFADGGSTVVTTRAGDTHWITPEFAAVLDVLEAGPCLKPWMVTVALVTVGVPLVVLTSTICFTPSVHGLYTSETLRPGQTEKVFTVAVPPIPTPRVNGGPATGLAIGNGR